MSLLDIILAILLPPVAVYRKLGPGKDLIISILLTICVVWLGGILHAFYVLTRPPAV